MALRKGLLSARRNRKQDQGAARVEIDRTSCSRFWANQFRVLRTAAAYVLMQELRLRAAGTNCARAQVWTLRERLLKLGARVVVSVRRLVLHRCICPSRSRFFPPSGKWRWHSELRRDSAPRRTRKPHLPPSRKLRITHDRLAQDHPAPQETTFPDFVLHLGCAP
jgi:hypothetical protein